MDPSGIRVGDRDRFAVEDRLRTAYAEGALSVEELEERLEANQRARTRGELEPLVADLPEPSAAGPPVREPRRRRTRRRLRRKLAIAAAVLLVWSIGIPEVVNVFGSTVRPVAVEPGAEETIIHDTTDPANPVELSSFSDRSITKVDVLNVFGSTVVVVPEDVRVANGVTSLFGSDGCAPCLAERADGPVVLQVDGLSLFGSVEIVTADALD